MANDTTKVALPVNRSAKRATQASMNSLTLQLCTRLGLSSRSVRTLLAIQSTLGTTGAGEVVSRSRMTLARCLKVGGSEESQRNAVSKLIGRLDREQRRAGVLLIDITAGTRDAVTGQCSSPQFCDIEGQLCEQADERRRRDPRWQGNVADKQAATDEALDWLLDQLPKVDDDDGGNDPERPRRPLGELVESSLAQVKRLAEKQASLMTEYDEEGEREARRFLRAAQRQLAQLEESLRKTEPSRRKGTTHESQGGSHEPHEPHPSCDSLLPSGELSDLAEADFPTELERDFAGGGVMANLPLGSTVSPSVSPLILTDFANSELEAGSERELPEPLEEAVLSVKLFESVGAETPLEVILLDDSTKVARRVIKAPTRTETREKLAGWLDEAERERLSLILRMTGAGEGRSRPLIQVDDCNAETVELLRPLSFMVIETSAGNYQVWLSVEVGNEAELVELRGRLFERLGATANGGGYGSTRWAGSRNFKPERGEFRVKLIHAARGRRVTEAELIERGILEPSPTRKNATATTRAQRESRSVTHSDWLPDYGRELQRFDGDRSRADASFAGILLRSGRSEGETVELLRATSPKASTRNDKYTERTVERVAAKVRG